MNVESEPLNPENEKIMDDKMDEYMKVSRELSDVFERVRQQQNIAADAFWDGLSYEDKCNAFHAVVERIFTAEIQDQGSYRHALYGVFGFGPDMYVRGMNCGFMALHNSIMTDEQFNEANKWMCEDEGKIKAALNVCLMAMLGKEELVEVWWKSPNKAFDMQTPEQVWETDYDRVRNYVVGFLQR